MATDHSDNWVLEARGVSKRFGGVRALRDVSLAIRPGEVLAVVGENGAGKSTLMKTLAGVHQPSDGTLYVDGQPVDFGNVQRALHAGVALIHQELNLAPHLDVGENLFLGRESHRFGIVSRAGMDAMSVQYLSRLGLEVSPRDRLDTLSLGQQQLVEIAKAISCNARVLIMDEPTSSLSQPESERLYDTIRQLSDEGVAIVYISHRMNEVIDLAHRVVVMRDGEVVGELSGDEIERDRMVRMMVGRDVSAFYHRTPHTAGDVVLSASGLRTVAYPEHPLEFSIRAGEIVGLAGLVGAGRSELLTTLFGVHPAAGGSMQLAGQAFLPRQAADAIDAGVVLAPEDRRQHGLFLKTSVLNNLSIACLQRQLSRLGFVRRTAETERAGQLSNQLSVKTASQDTIVRNLSGGNQQKVVLGKWLATNPRLLLLDEPTRGIDVSSKSEIYQLMHELAGRGLAILFASSDMEEVLNLSDRVLVMDRGKIAGELNRDAMSEQAIMHLAVEQSADQPIEPSTQAIAASNS